MSVNEKAYNRRKPFTRIESPSYDDTRARVTGRGFDCGCRSPFNDYDPSVLEHLGMIVFNIVGALPTMAFKKLLATMPAWVPVIRENVPESAWRALPEQEHEVEGILSESFQTWTDVPVKQWHLWYDWNFHLVPATGYKYLHGLGNHGRNMECEWDCGGMGDYDFDGLSGRRPTLDKPGPMFGRDWAWPMPMQNVWLTGRWIYDCGHASGEDKTGPNVGLMRSELHPCKAVATARWEAVKFNENERHVPAIQFMFFGCRRGGYKDFRSINDQDYEFIVDLPKEKSETVGFPIGHTPNFAVNTLLVRPRLLIKLDYEPFKTAYGQKAGAGDSADPRIELLPSVRPGEPPCQARVCIPLTQLAGNIDTYGVIVSLGWFDPTRIRAAKVKKVNIAFTHIKRFDIHEGFVSGEGEWQFKVGVNGRWHAVSDSGVSRESLSMRLSIRETFYLAEDDELVITAHGMEEDSVGGIMRENGWDRTLKDPDNAPYTWNDDIDQRDNNHASGVAREMVGKLATTLNNQNDKLGVINPGEKFLQTDTANPITLQKLMELKSQPGREIRCQLTARRDDNRNKIDYILFYRVTWEDLAN